MSPMPEMVKNNLAKMSKFLTENFNYRVIYQLFELKIQPKVGFLRPRTGFLRPNTIPKYFLTNFEKVQKMTFLTPKMVKNEPSKPPKRSIFGSIVDLRALF